MRELIYDVALSLDGYIAGEDADVSSFLAEGDHVDAYLARLADYDTVLLGRRTYEFGYQFGLEPGQRAYPNMEHYVFSSTLEVPPGSPVHIVRDDFLAVIDDLRAAEGGPIYVCGGGALAGLLLRAGYLDRVIVKLNPCVIGGGVPLFGEDPPPTTALKLVSSEVYTSGVALLSYEPR